jgi:hypothetical protein
LRNPLVLPRKYGLPDSAATLLLNAFNFKMRTNGFGYIFPETTEDVSDLFHYFESAVIQVWYKHTKAFFYKIVAGAYQINIINIL